MAGLAGGRKQAPGNHDRRPSGANGRKALLTGALKTLNEREPHILTERRLKDNPTTLGELSDQYAISSERVRQIEFRAVEKLQKAMKIAV